MVLRTGAAIVALSDPKCTVSAGCASAVYLGGMEGGIVMRLRLVQTEISCLDLAVDRSVGLIASDVVTMRPCSAGIDIDSA